MTSASAGELQGGGGIPEAVELRRGAPQRGGVQADSAVDGGEDIRQGDGVLGEQPGSDRLQLLLGGTGHVAGYVPACRHEREKPVERARPFRRKLASHGLQRLLHVVTV